MCGIVGYIGHRDSVPILLDGLERLEYRGYDSAGLAVWSEDGILIRRCEGKLAGLKDRVGQQPLTGSLGVGHTRWATHGRPSETNAHPHLSGDVAVVHNGIIENYMELKAELVAAGREFDSETDTEIAAHLIDFYRDQGASFEEAVFKALGRIQGSFALGIVNRERPDLLVAARRESPLIVGYGDGEYFIASDVPALLEHTRQVSYLDDGQVAFLSRDGIKFTDLGGREVTKNIHQVLWDSIMAQKAGYKHFMQKEIFEQPRAVIDTFRGRVSLEQGRVLLPDLPFTAEDIQAIDKIFIVACGTSYHAGLVGKFMIEELTRLPVEVDLGSEFRYRDPILDEHTLLVLISQSGETADTLAGLREGQDKGARSLAICNVVGSSVARSVEGIIYTQAGPEIGVASTKAFTTQLVCLYLLAMYVAQVRGLLPEDKGRTMIRELMHLPRLLEEILEEDDRIKAVGRQYSHARDFLYLGRGINYPLALEGALKLKEISYIHAEGYPAGEMKHGPIALIDENLPVVVCAPPGKTLEKVLSNMEEVKARSGKVIALTGEGSHNVQDKADDVILIPAASEMLMPIVLAVPLQLLA
ncbi:MAG: glutamine--fructose-6-phosphate transaminase (isomerizing), partial [Thermodesulfobacteriota bacterium]|nr:glutamine--fructose-6-phosphate transaminase (isomerizing) [Thermodesulfobacteriota bacterium]